MPSPDATKLLRLARRDLAAAARLLPNEVPEAIWGFHIQQAIEKALKGWLHSLGIEPPYTHDIRRLVMILEQQDCDVSSLHCFSAFTVFAVQWRYDDEVDELALDRQAVMSMVEQLIRAVEQGNH